MAKFYPAHETFGSLPKMFNAAEKSVLKKIAAQFSDDWTVLTNLHYTTNGACLMPRVCGEIDFLLCHEIFGVLAIEVKSGKFTHDGGEWFQNERLCGKTPWAQVAEQTRFIAKSVCRTAGFESSNELPFAVAGVPCFVETSRETFPPEMRGNAIFAEDLDALPEFAENFLRNSRSREAALATRRCDWMLVTGTLRSLVEIAESLHDRSRDESEKLLRLTEEQGRVLNEMTRGLARFRVRGGAGTGKSLIALEKARRLASQGKRVLLLCYNLLLCENFRMSTRKFPNIKACAFYEFAQERFGVSDSEYRTLPASERSAFFENLTARLIRDLDDAPTAFDSVIVDEAQDFTESMWRAVEAMTRPDGDFIIFYDPNQNIFRETLALPPSLADAPEYRLSKNCRCTQEIFNAIRERFCDDSQILPGTPNGEKVCEFFPETSAESRQMLESVLGSLRTRSVPAKSVTIIGSHSLLEKTSVGADARLGKWRIVAPQHRIFECETVEYFSCYRFKGCETGTLILFEFPENANPRVLYAALTRAVNRLVIIHPPRSRESA